MYTTVGCNVKKRENDFCVSTGREGDSCNTSVSPILSGNGITDRSLACGGIPLNAGFLGASTLAKPALL